MCGRFYVDEEMEKEILKIISYVNRRIRTKESTRDVFPTSDAGVLSTTSKDIQFVDMKWGFSLPFEKKQIINARQESLMTKPFYLEIAETNRCCVPVRGFYEWDSSKNKYRFERKDKEIIFLAGIWKMEEDGQRFTVITTGANNSMKNIHHRMPLILEKDQITPWLKDTSRLEMILLNQSVELDHFCDYEQLSFSFFETDANNQDPEL